MICCLDSDNAEMERFRGPDPILPSGSSVVLGSERQDKQVLCEPFLSEYNPRARNHQRGLPT